MDLAMVARVDLAVNSETLLLSPELIGDCTATPLQGTLLFGDSIADCCDMFAHPVMRVPATNRSTKDGSYYNTISTGHVKGLERFPY
jgi:hypothetical protein